MKIKLKSKGWVLVNCKKVTEADGWIYILGM